MKYPQVRRNVSCSFYRLSFLAFLFTDPSCPCGMLDDWRRETGREWFPSFCLPRAFCCVSEAPCREKRAGEVERELLFVVPLQLVSLVFSLCTDPCHLFGVVDDWLRTQAVSVVLPAYPPSLSLACILVAESSWCSEWLAGEAEREFSFCLSVSLVACSCC